MGCAVRDRSRSSHSCRVEENRRYLWFEADESQALKYYLGQAVDNHQERSVNGSIRYRCHHCSEARDLAAAEWLAVVAKLVYLAGVVIVVVVGVGRGFVEYFVAI